ncbi:MAG: TrmJ/YjtD family RNA methyltransferase [Bryobacterales bacterium]|nr:TrmJ/YjtD family RNA methyltransferase [Bryobacterales bacterium]
MVLVAPRNPLNIGAAARAMSNFGFSELRLVNPYEVAFREARSAVNASHVLQGAVEFPTVADAVADCRLVVGTTDAAHRDLQHPVRRLEYAARLIRRHPGPVALLFGSEKFGLSTEDLAYCHWLLRIPTREEHPAMNLGQAVAVCLYELVRQRPVRDPKSPRPASAGELERLTEVLLHVLQRSGYVNPRTAASTALKVRRLVRRLSLSSADAAIWTGMLRQIQWKLGVAAESSQAHE